jgi:mRNA-degrading endonuclease RelE of RelBE toxin-antitoxin system
MVTVSITPEVAKQIDNLPLTIRARVLAIVGRLAKWPAVRGAKPLRGNLAGRYRIRTGDYRVQFYVAGETLVVERVGHRDGFYE